MSTAHHRIAATLTVAASLAVASPAVATDRAPTCHEDQSCWVWSTMGNQQRGVTLKSGRKVVVTPARFARLVRQRRIDTRRTPKLRGDYTALVMGCSR